MAANVGETLNRLVNGIFGNGKAKGLMTSFDEIGVNLVNKSEADAAQRLIQSVKHNGGEFQEHFDPIMNSIFEAIEKGRIDDYVLEKDFRFDRNEIMYMIEEGLTKDSKDKALEKSKKAISSYKEGIARHREFYTSERDASAAAKYLGNETDGFTATQLAQGYFRDPNNGLMRTNVAKGVGITAAAGVGIGTGAAVSKEFNRKSLQRRGHGYGQIGGVPFY